MAMLTRVDGNRIIAVHHPSGEENTLATCDCAREAENLLVLGWKANDRREYTKAARLIAKAASLPGFQWVTNA